MAKKKVIFLKNDSFFDIKNLGSDIYLLPDWAEDEPGGPISAGSLI